VTVESKGFEHTQTLSQAPNIYNTLT